MGKEKKKKVKKGNKWDPHKSQWEENTLNVAKKSHAVLRIGRYRAMQRKLPFPVSRHLGLKLSLFSSLFPFSSPNLETFLQRGGFSKSRKEAFF